MTTIHVHPERLRLPGAVAVAAAVGVVAVISGLFVGASPEAHAATVPLAPSGLSISAASGNVPALVWADNSADESGFEIEKCLPANGVCDFQPAGTSPANGYTWLDQSAALGATYRVRAVNAAGGSAWTTASSSSAGLSLGRPVAVLAATPLSGTVPLAVDFDGSQSSGLDFSILSDWSWSFGDGATASGQIAQHTYTAPGIYRVMLTVTDTVGSTSYAETRVSASPPPAVVVAPTNFTATGLKRAVTLNWTNARDTTTTELRLQRCKGATCTTFDQIAVLAPTATTFTDTQVKSGSIYRYIIVAIDVPAADARSAGPVQARVR